MIYFRPRNNKMLLIILALLLQTVYSFSQSTNFCTPDQSLQAKFNTPSFLEKYKKQVPLLKRGMGSDTTNYIIPVVFRIVHDKDVPIGQGENLTDGELIQSLQWLNDIFRGINCPGDVPGLNTNISFCLAKRDINGNTTSGITRYTSNLTDVRACCDLELMKNLTKTGGSPIADPFPDSNYISIWVVRSICPDCIPLCDIGGLATGGGIVVEAVNFKTCSGAKLITHEMGHYFGLPHTFQNGCSNNDCLTDGDGICDTPPVDDFTINSYNCSSSNPGTKNSCTSDVNPADPNNPFTVDQPDLQNNFMDYSPPDCKNSFTDGQRSKMRFNLTNALSKLLNSPGCSDTSSAEVIINDTNYIFISPPVCTQPTRSSLIRGDNKACQDDILEYYTYFTCSIPNQWQVLGPNKIISSTNTSIRIHFTKPGIDTIIINAKNNCGDFTDTVFVSTEKIPDISFLNPEYLLCPGESVTFYAKADSAIIYAVNNTSGAIYYPLNDSIYLPTHYTDSCYTVNAKYSSGNCTAKKIFCVKMLCSEELFVPNSFTPNADGLNDILKPVYYGNPGALKMVSFHVYSRWGLLMYTTQNLNAGWDGNYKGKPQPAGAVVWALEYINHKGTKIRSKGSSLLIR